MTSLLGDLDAAALLAAEESGLLARRRAEVDGLERLLAWCDLHSVDPQDSPRAVPIRHGGDHLVQVGGDGTPSVAQLCFAEFAVAARAGELATRFKAADALDLRHRLPLVWALVQDLRIEVWLARRIASMSRRLDHHAVAVVDAACAAGADLTAGRLLEVAEAAVIEADPDAHRTKLAADNARVGVWMRTKRPGDRIEDLSSGTGDGQGASESINLRLPTADALEFTALVDDLAHALATQHHPSSDDDVKTMDQHRADAVALLADPHAAVRFLDGDTAEDPPPTAHGRKPRVAVLHVHLSAGLPTGTFGPLARGEGLGPMLLEQLQDLLARRDVHLQPVIDLAHTARVDGYEHPTTVRARTLLRTTGDVFPHATTSTSDRLDHDHPTPYVPPDTGGPPGQTGDHNDAPLTRRHHRAKTHLPYQLRQFSPGAYRWETPHGLVRVVTPHGTTVVQAIRDPDGRLIGEIYPA